MKKAELTKIENISETNRLGIFEKEKALEVIQQEFRDAEKAIAETEKSNRRAEYGQGQPERISGKTLCSERRVRNQEK